MRRDVTEGRWNALRQPGIFLVHPIPYWQAIRERLNKHSSERPDIATRQYRSLHSFGRGVHAATLGGFLRVTHRTNSVARKFQFITASYDVCRLDTPMYQAVPV